MTADRAAADTLRADLARAMQQPFANPWELADMALPTVLRYAAAQVAAVRRRRGSDGCAWCCAHLPADVERGEAHRICRPARGQP